MPQPRPRTAFPTAALAAQGLSVDQVDPDYLNYLQHVRPDGNSYVVELPARGVSPPVTVKNGPEMPAVNGEAQIALVPSPAPAGRGGRVEQEIPPADAPQWYETGNMDEDYRKFWRQTRMVDGRLVLKVEDKVVRYELDDVPVRLSGIADSAEKNSRKEVAAVVAFGEDGDGDGVGVGVGEKDKVAPIRTDGRALESRVRDSPARRQRMKVKQIQEEKGEGKCGAEKINVVDREDNMLVVVPTESLNTVNTETNLSIYGLDAEPHIASGSYGVVWPTHIMERPESSFKKMLLRDLRRPCSEEEYEKLLRLATDHLPATKGRQLRRGVKYYNCEHETNRSYFDSHPDLAKQVTSTSYPNQLALLRGFFFWLKNVTNDDQFRPWRDDFRLYSIIPRE